jgi:hypothetical protein
VAISQEGRWLIRGENGEPVLEGLRTFTRSSTPPHRSETRGVSCGGGAKHGIRRASFALTFDVYGHLFALKEEDTALMAASEVGLLERGLWPPGPNRSLAIPQRLEAGFPAPPA